MNLSHRPTAFAMRWQRTEQSTAITAYSQHSHLLLSEQYKCGIGGVHRLQTEMNYLITIHYTNWYTRNGKQINLFCHLYLYSCICIGWSFFSMKWAKTHHPEIAPRGHWLYDFTFYLFTFFSWELQHQYPALYPDPFMHDGSKSDFSNPNEIWLAFYCIACMYIDSGQCILDHKSLYTAK